MRMWVRAQLCDCATRITPGSRNALSGLLSFIMEIHGARITPGFSKDDHLGDARSAAGGNAGPPSLTQHSGATPTNGAQAGDIEAVKPADIGVGVASA